MLKLNYEFRDRKLLILAMTQSGISSKHNNERLEFLGDRVLGLAIADLLMDMYPTETEGELARRHALLVSTKTLAGVGRSLELTRYVRHGHMTAGKTHHMLANAMEAIIGAIYVDGGFEAARKFIVDLWFSLAQADSCAPKDAKTMLQEYVQKHDSGNLPVYEYTEMTGESHDPVFTVQVSAMGQSAYGSGSSKKIASTAAAAALLKILEKPDSEV
ncbi:MAG: ribonuclease III [Alphaproteobacteria bacterium]|nr:ribonuclease III [Alphaproteobacteria bacterium]